MGMRDDILDQPAVLARLLKEGRPAVEQAAALLRRGDVHFIYVAARGTSDHAALYAKYVLGIRNRIPTALAAPSMFTLYGAEPDLHHALVLGISQSGQSPDILKVLSAGKAQGQPTLVITNDAASPLAREATCVVDILAGEEKSVAATKTYSAELLSIAMLSAALSEDPSRWEELAQVPHLVSGALDAEAQAHQAADRFVGMDRCMILGRGFNYPSAFEWALKLKELAGVFAEAYSPADFLHGPIAAATPETPILAIAPTGVVLEDVLGVLHTLAQERRSPTLVVSDHPQACSLADLALPIPAGAPEWLSPIVAIGPAQLFCYWLTVLKGLDPEAPPGLSKVTRTM